MALVAVGMGGGLAAADPGNETNGTVANERADQLEGETNETSDPLAGYSDRAEFVDETMILSDWEYTGGQFVLEFENSGLSRPVTLEPRQEMSEGTQRITWYEEMVPRGGGTVTVPADKVSGEAALRISTADSRSEQRAIQISTGTTEDNPFQYFGGESGLFAGVGLSIAMSGGAAGFVLWRENDGVVRA
ncbi:hypothetical protein [Natrononativus amylolyticus]|uniref:hypothetical protein n=1 Tax=Natrononativus amylolyticus TaxID=2963434 RepID=UPI0020CE78B7|nr:hypothetical protein [Natrononativus amylolyticus]